MLSASLNFLHSSRVVAMILRHSTCVTCVANCRNNYGGYHEYDKGTVDLVCKHPKCDLVNTSFTIAAEIKKKKKKKKFTYTECLFQLCLHI